MSLGKQSQREASSEDALCLGDDFAEESDDLNGHLPPPVMSDGYMQNELEWHVHLWPCDSNGRDLCAVFNKSPEEGLEIQVPKPGRRSNADDTNVQMSVLIRVGELAENREDIVAWSFVPSLVRLRFLHECLCTIGHPSDEGRDLLGEVLGLNANGPESLVVVEPTPSELVGKMVEGRPTVVENVPQDRPPLWRGWGGVEPEVFAAGLRIELWADSFAFRLDEGVRQLVKGSSGVPLPG